MFDAGRNYTTHTTSGARTATKAPALNVRFPESLDVALPISRNFLAAVASQPVDKLDKVLLTRRIEFSRVSLLVDLRFKSLIVDPFFKHFL